MIRWTNWPIFFQFLLKIFLFHFLFLLSLRFAYLFYFLQGDLLAQTHDVLYGLYLGVKYDLRLILIYLSPLFLLTSLSLVNLKKSKVAIAFIKYYLVLVSTLVFVFYIADFGHVAYLESRININALKLAENFQIALEMIWQTYPVLRWLLVFMAFSFVNLWWINQSLKIWKTKVEGITFQRKFSIFTLTFILWALGLYGKISWYPLRWSEAYFSGSSRISNFSVNPILQFFTSMEFKKQSFDLKKVKEHYNQVADYLGMEEKDRDEEKLNFKRVVYPTKKIIGTPNVVVVIMESMVAQKMRYFGNKLEATPFLDELIPQSLFYRNFYVPAQATARSVFGLVTGIPDISAVKTSSRNPFIVEQHSVLNDLVDYEKYYFLSGSASWGEIRGIFSHNIDNINIFEEGSYTAKRADVWGISDYDLYEEANKVFRSRKSKEPFFAVVQTSSFHRPYTIPENRGDFQVIKDLPSANEMLDQNGFISLDEYNSLRFADYSVRHFFEVAKKEDYFDNTIFVIFGDHGLPIGNATNVTEGQRTHQLENFHVPFIIHGPKFFPAKVEDIFVSEVDVFPSILSLLGVPYTNTTLGRDIFDPKFKSDLGVFTFYWYVSPPTFGVINREHFLVTNTEGREELVEYLSKDISNLKEHLPEKFTKMKDLADGLYYTSQYLLYHNPHQPKIGH